MTSDKLVKSLFEPIADHIAIYFGQLSEDQTKEFRPAKTRNHGNERSFGDAITCAVPALVRCIRTKGPDLVLQDGTEIELKAASDCWPQYMAGTEKSVGWRKYLTHTSYPRFAGCLFLADGTKKQNIEEIRRLSEPAVELRAHRFFEDVMGKRWVIGLLVRTDFS